VSTTAIPGYAFGAVSRSPVTLEELELLKQAAGWTPDDDALLRRAGELLVPRSEEILDVWYGFVGGTPQLLEAFRRRSDGEPDADYLARVRARFGRWIADTCATPWGQEWLDYQHEIGVRHHRSGKNRTDGVDAAPVVPLRYLVALAWPVTATVRPFLEAGGDSPAEVERLLDAWRKAVLVQVALWCRPYVAAEDF
jgi:hypothetical protein